MSLLGEHGLLGCRSNRLYRVRGRGRGGLCYLLCLWKTGLFWVWCFFSSVPVCMVTFSEVMKLKHDTLTMRRLVTVQLHACLLSAVCCGEWIIDSSHGISPRKSHNANWIGGWLGTRSFLMVVVGWGGWINGILYWIYLLPATQQTIGCNGFITTCFDSHESSSGYVQNLLVLVLLLLTVLEVVGRYEVVAVLTLIWLKFWKHISRNVTRNRLIFIIT
jgi:hypothetical protein